MRMHNSKKQQNIESWHNRIVLVFGLGTAGIGGITLFLWFLGVYDSINPNKHYVPMVDEAAFAFLIFGIALAISGKDIKYQWLSYFFILLLQLIGFLCVIDYASGYTLGISNFLGRRHIIVDNLQTGRMSLITGICFIAESIALFLISNVNKFDN